MKVACLRIEVVTSKAEAPVVIEVRNASPDVVLGALRKAERELSERVRAIRKMERATKLLANVTERG